MAFLLAGIIGSAGCAKDEPISLPTSSSIATSSLASVSTPSEPEGDPVVTSVPNDPSDDILSGEVSQELILPRDSYNASRNVSELIKPHFLAMDSGGNRSIPKESRISFWRWNGRSNYA